MPRRASSRPNLSSRATNADAASFAFVIRISAVFFVCDPSWRHVMLIEVSMRRTTPQPPGEPTHFPPLQELVSVQARPSSHGPVLKGCWQEPLPLQTSSVHGFPSSFTSHGLPLAS